jgi:hypothetical protein
MRIPAPSTPNGPCEAVCGHLRCADLFQAACRICPGCGEPIGFDREYEGFELNAWHASCLEDFLASPGGAS